MSAGELHVKAANILPKPDPSQTQSTTGTALSIYTAPRQPGQILHCAVHFVSDMEVISARGQVTHFCALGGRYQGFSPRPIR
jgi:hypothetical protein